MSDIGLNFSALDILEAGAIIAVPVTTILLVILGARRLGARGSTQRRGRRWVLNAGIIGVAPLWAIGAGILAWLLVDDLIEEMHAASRHFTLTGERSISGIPLPTGSEVNLDDYNRLVSVRLPAAATVTIEGTAWGGGGEFFPTHPPPPP